MPIKILCFITSTYNSRKALWLRGLRVVRRIYPLIRIQFPKQLRRHIRLHRDPVLRVLLLQKLAVLADGLDPAGLGVGVNLFQVNPAAADDLLQNAAQLV